MIMRKITLSFLVFAKKAWLLTKFWLLVGKYFFWDYTFAILVKFSTFSKIEERLTIKFGFFSLKNVRVS